VSPRGKEKERRASPFPKGKKGGGEEDEGAEKIKRRKGWVDDNFHSSPISGRGWKKEGTTLKPLSSNPRNKRERGRRGTLIFFLERFEKEKESPETAGHHADSNRDLPLLCR